MRTPSSFRSRTDNARAGQLADAACGGLKAKYAGRNKTGKQFVAQPTAVRNQCSTTHRSGPRHSSRRAWKPPVAAAPGASVEVSRLKADIVRLAGDKYGLDK